MTDDQLDKLAAWYRERRHFMQHRHYTQALAIYAKSIGVDFTLNDSVSLFHHIMEQPDDYERSL